jgi:D-serine deaminase-like pyridoxal phosphate-dependent protein
MTTPLQTTTPLSVLTLPSKDALVKEFVGKKLSTLRTPALIIDRKRFVENCERVTGETAKRGMGFRAHVKSESRVRRGQMNVGQSDDDIEGSIIG